MELRIEKKESKTDLFLRLFSDLKDFKNRFFNIPSKFKIIRVSNHYSEIKTDVKLTKNIATEIKTFNGVRIVNVKTDVDFRFLLRI
jgi:hypothetical protein